ncbi:MAG: hypothetical protein ACYC8T_36285, partial [Myxococcaceae bacterium]
VVAVLVLAAAPNLQAARVCMSAVELQNRECSDIVQGFVSPDVRAEAQRRCNKAFHRGLELCLVENGIPVDDAQRQAWQRLDDSSEALATCFSRVQTDATWCASQVASRSDLGNCRAVAERGLVKCRAEHQQREESRDAERKAAERASLAKASAEPRAAPPPLPRRNSPP